MANALYDHGRESFLAGELDFGADTIKVILIDTDDYTANMDTDQFYVDVATVSRVGTATALASKTEVDGVADAADITLATVTGDQSEAILIYEEEAAESDSRLIALIDTATGLPVTPNGGDIVIQWDAGASKIFKL